MLSLHRNQRGDTIIEVMIALAILSMALSISYATAHKSLQATQQAQETAEASRYAQRQVEAIRSQAGNGSAANDPLLQAPGYEFCMNPSNNIAPATDAVCTYDRYSFKIVYVGGVFKVVGQWTDINGADIDKITLYYRTY